MKKHINLFRKKKVDKNALLLSSQISKIGTILGVILFVVFAFFAVRVILLKRDILKLSQTKQILLTTLMNDKDSEAKMTFLNNKYSQLDTFLKDDAAFLPYYKIMKDVLSQSSNSAVIDSISISKDRSVQFLVSFGEFNDLISFLSYTESNEFLKHFEVLSLSNFSIKYEQIRGIKEGRKVYQLSLAGVFKEIK